LRSVSSIPRTSRRTSLSAGSINDEEESSEERRERQFCSHLGLDLFPNLNDPATLVFQLPNILEALLSLLEKVLLAVKSRP